MKSTESRDMQAQEVTTPNPDPTAATNVALLREITGSREIAQILVNFTRELVEAKMTGDKETLTVRIDHLENYVRKEPALVRELVEAAVKNVDEKLKVQDQQFSNVQVQFKERDTRQEQTTKDSSKAIDAAFTAADKAITKTETGFTKQIEEQGKRIESVSKTAEDKVSDLKELINDQKERITALEARTAGITQQKTDTQTVQAQNTASTSVVVAIAFGAVGVIIGLGSLAVAAAAMMRH
jgi:hypothetical protein